MKKKIDLEIRNLSVRDKKIKVHQNLPGLPFSLILLSISEGGKTNCCVNLILKYKKYFKDNVYIFSKTPDKTIKKHLIDNKKINAIKFNSLVDKNGNDIIQEIINSQKELIDNDLPAPQVLLYLDDFYEKSMRSRMGLFLDLYSQAAHYNISIIQITHNWTTLISDTRRLCKNFFIFKIYDEIQKEFLARELCGNLKMNYKDFIKVLDYITDEPYAFMYLNKLEKKFYRKLKPIPDEELKTLLEKPN